MKILSILTHDASNQHGPPGSDDMENMGKKELVGGYALMQVKDRGDATCHIHEVESVP